MRSDMNKILTERARIKPRGSPKGWMKDVPLEDMPGHESMTRKYGWERKELNENLAPLYRYLRTNVGRPWDEVNSEICKNIRLASTVQRHVLQHLWDAVETKTFLDDDGRVYYMDRNGAHLADDCYYTTLGRFYVHPVTGILHEATLRRRNLPDVEDENAASSWRKVISETYQLHKIKGVWYGLDMARTERPDDPYHSVHDAAYGIVSRGQICFKDSHHKMVFVATTMEKYGEHAVHCTRKRQLNKKDLKRFGLR